MNTPRLVGPWVALCAVAEFAGIASAAVWYGGVSVLIGEPQPIPARVAAWLLMSLAAVPEGLVLGGLQALGMIWFLPRLSARKWIAATIAVGLLGWAIGTFIPLFLVAEAPAQPSPDPGLMQTAAFAALFGIAVGAVFGLGQSFALPAGTRRSPWIVANTAGWALGLPAIYAAAQIAGDLEGWVPRILIWAAGGLVAGAAIGIATGVVLVRLARGNSKGERPRS